MAGALAPYGSRHEVSAGRSLPRSPFFSLGYLLLKIFRRIKQKEIELAKFFVWSARGRRNDPLDSGSLLGSKPNSKTTKLQVITTVVIGSPSAWEPHCGLMPAQQARL